MAVQAQSLYFSEDWSSAAALLHPVSGLDDIFSGIPSPPPAALHPPQNHFHLRLPVAQNQRQNLNTTGFDFCNQLGASVSPSTFNSFLPTQFSENLGAQLDLQRHELDCIIQLQSEKLKFALQEQRKQQLAALLCNLESRTLNVIRQKEEELGQATKKAMELQDCLRKAEMESDMWQRVAKANETMVTDLNNELEQVRERLVLVSSETDDAESCCENRVAIMEEDQLAEEKRRKLVCKSCQARSSCVLFLPCRHLCSCKFCEGFLGFCPVCDSAKEASMEVFFV
ncbi:BOI-related E3 ubiquitin-protein ligase 2 [Pyrus ussuriensis x Pyrus communis]|uniref:BOI-related E3 ubiquitin-protein ligase 2 n=1 Tax=Pyrus ussuriensis x Pyrus communis TaxID=2448454 RepID=A0A5N5HPW3_9ROSA|nr:BOI-related E3 ubiquitin-protein ligase 2 [Pyrus ussuriensis x Pyrus communis]